MRLAKERERLNVIADQYGVPTSASWLAEISLALVLDVHHQLRAFPSRIYHAVPQGEATWYTVACDAVQAAIDAGAELKLRPDAIEAIQAANFPLIAPRPMNSRMAKGSLELALINSLAGAGTVTKLELLQQSWGGQVATYVQDLVQRKLI